MIVENMVLKGSHL